MTHTEDSSSISSHSKFDVGRSMFDVHSWFLIRSNWSSPAAGAGQTSDTSNLKPSISENLLSDKSRQGPIFSELVSYCHRHVPPTRQHTETLAHFLCPSPTQPVKYFAVLAAPSRSGAGAAGDRGAASISLICLLKRSGSRSHV
jgi:hypothetical protein